MKKVDVHLTRDQVAEWLGHYGKDYLEEIARQKGARQHFVSRWLKEGGSNAMGTIDSGKICGSCS